MITNNGQKIISVSIDPVPDKELVPYIQEMIDNKIDYIHCDVMDGSFVPQSSYDDAYIAALNQRTTIPLDVHLMTDNPMDNFERYIEAGANILTVHYEVFNSRKQLLKTLKRINELKCFSGVAISPMTEISNAVDFLNYCDIILVMGVEPGLSGQQFIEETYIKVRMLNSLRKQFNFNFMIAVDGGITPPIANRLKSYGADMIISGSYLYRSANRKRDIREMRKRLDRPE